MQHYNYLIIGGGMTAAAAVEGIREIDSEGSIGLVSAEANPPYDRPPLSKGLWKGKEQESIWRAMDNFGVELHLEQMAQPLDPRQKQVIVRPVAQLQHQGPSHQETVFTYDTLLLATGGTPRRLPFGKDQILYYRTLEDYHRLRALTETKQRFAVIGGGFIGSEIAAALAMNGKEVVMIFPEKGIGGAIFPPDLTLFLNDYYQEKGVEVMAEDLVSSLEELPDQQISLTTKSGRRVEVDAVVAGIGIEPNVALAQRAGLKVDNGIIVDEFLRTSDPAIFAAGDVANFYNPILEMRLRVEHEDNANTMGRLAGRAMAGESAPYNYLPFFYSDLFDLGYEAIGELNPTLDVVANWREPFREGIIYYLRNRRVRGVILWNSWGLVDAARQLLAEPKLFKPEELTDRLEAVAS